MINIKCEAILPSIRKHFFHQRMIGSWNKLELSDKKIQTNGYLRDESYKGKLLFTMKYFVSFGTYCQSMYLM